MAMQAQYSVLRFVDEFFVLPPSIVVDAFSVLRCVDEFFALPPSIVVGEEGCAATFSSSSPAVLPVLVFETTWKLSCEKIMVCSTDLWFSCGSI